MKLFKCLILPISIICCCNNIGNTTNNKIPLIKYLNNEIPFDSSQTGIPFNCLHNIISSFRNNEPLNNNQKEFIKRLCNDNSPINFNTVSKEIVTHCYQPCFYINSLASQQINDDNLKFLDFSEVYHIYELIRFLSTDDIDMMYNKILGEVVTHEDIKNIYHNFLSKLKQCYELNIITEWSYTSLLKSLLYSNTNRMFYKLGRNTSKIKSKEFNKDNHLYSLFIDTFDRSETEDFNNGISHDSNDSKFNFSSTSELQNSYKLYKSVMNQIIDNSLTILLFDSDETYTMQLLEETIFEPIILGILGADWETNELYDKGCYSSYPPEYYDNKMKIVTKIYSKIKENMKIINQEFEITEKIKIKKIKKNIKTLYSKDQDTDEETESTKSKYITQQIDSLLLPDKLPYEVKYKKYKNREYTAQQVDNFSLSDTLSCEEKDKNSEYTVQQVDSFLLPDKLSHELKYKGKKNK